MKISEIVQRLVAGAAEYPLPGTLILLETGKTLHLRLLNDFWFVFTIDTMGGYFSRKIFNFLEIENYEIRESFHPPVSKS